MIGRDAFFKSRRPAITPTSSCCLVGDTAKARKGSSFDHVASLLADARPRRSPSRLTTGLSSGEGLIWAVRDPQGQDPGAQRQAAAGRRTRIRVSAEGHRPRDLDLSRPALRLGRTAARAADPHRARDAPPSAHISIIGHITQTELAPPHHHRRARQRLPEQVPDLRVPSRATATRRRRPRTRSKAPASASYLASDAANTPTPAGQITLDQRRTGAVVARLPAADPGARRARRTHHRPRRSAHDPPRAPLRAARRQAPHPARAPPRRARALGLHRRSAALGARPSDRRPARRATPRRTRCAPRRAHPPAGDAPTAEEIMRALEAEQRAARATSDTRSVRTADSPRSARSPHRPSTRRRPHHRRLLPPRRWAIACSLLAAVLGVLAVQLASGTGPNRGGHPSRTVGSGPTAPTGALLAAAMNSFLGAEHAADRRLSPPRARTTRTSRPRRPHHQPARVPDSTSPAGSHPQSASTSSATDASDSIGTTERISQSSSSPSSSATSSGSGQSPPTTQSNTAPHSNSSSSSATQSKATLRSLVTGAGSCSCQ